MDDIIPQPDSSCNTIKNKFHAAAFPAKVHLHYLTLQILPREIRNFAPVALLNQRSNSHNASSGVYHFRKFEVLPGKFPVSKNADNAVDAKVLKNRFIRIQE